MMHADGSCRKRRLVPALCTPASSSCSAGGCIATRATYSLTFYVPPMQNCNKQLFGCTIGILFSLFSVLPRAGLMLRVARATSHLHGHSSAGASRGFRFVPAAVMQPCCSPTHGSGASQ